MSWSQTHFLPGSSEEGHVWLGASLSGSCLPDTPSFSVKVENKQDHEWAINFFDCIFRLLDSEHNAEVQNYTEIYNAKDAPSPPALCIYANLKLSPYVSAVQFLLFHCGIS